MHPPSASPPPPQLNAAGRSLRRVWKYFMAEVDDLMTEKKADALLVAASVIAAMNYQAALSPPGDTKTFANGRMEYQAGQAIAAYVSPYEYKRFSVANTISFTFSVATMFFILSGLSLRRRIFSLLVTASMIATITATTFGYKLAVEATTPDHDESLLAGWRFVNGLVNGALISSVVVAGVTIVVFCVGCCSNRRATQKT